MIRTQIQIPDELYQRLQSLARRNEWTLAETLRRGAEFLLRLYPVPELTAADWKPPAALDLGELRAPVDQWREIANLSDRTAVLTKNKERRARA